MFRLAIILGLFELPILQVMITSASGWNGLVKSWGTMREVFSEGKATPRIALAKVDKDQIIGVGAVEGLAGEITIWDGQIWITKDTAEAAPASDQSATLLITAKVSEWNSDSRRPEIAAGRFEEVIARAISDAGWGVKKPTPFVVDGNLTVKAHAIRGKCPHGGDEGNMEPVTFTIENQPAVLVGFYIEGAEGQVTHHGTKIHAHVLTKETPARMGHADSVSLAAGATIRVPFRRQLPRTLGPPP